MTDKMPEEWAGKRVNELVNSDYSSAKYVDKLFVAFARYIEQHEEPPVDPLRAAMDEAFETGLRLSWGDPDGRQKFVEEVRANLTKRGITLTKDTDQ